MNESQILNKITSLIGEEYIGDDCAYLKDLDIVITQDSLVEDVHFKREWCTPFQLGYKSAVVNISDVLVSGAEPKYITVALSLPNNLPDDFITNFYSGLNSALNSVKIIGGDITGSVDKIMISICAIGTANGRFISSRKNAKPDYIIVTKGNYGSSAAGLNQLFNNGNNIELIKSHLEPNLEYEFTESISKTVSEPYAMMDTSDGLVDALFKIAVASDVKAVVDYDKIPHLPDINKELVLFGGEDYKPITAIPEKYINLLPDVSVIGYITEYDGVRVDISGEKFCKYDDLRVFNHFGERNG